MNREGEGRGGGGVDGNWRILEKKGEARLVFFFLKPNNCYSEEARNTYSNEINANTGQGTKPASAIYCNHCFKCFPWLSLLCNA